MAFTSLKAIHLKKVYKKRAVVDGVSFEVRQGEAVALLGANGAGKTTSFYMVTGLVKSDEGQVFIGDQDVTYYPMYKRARLGMSYLPQEPSIFRGLTVENNIKAVLEILVPNKDDQEALLESLLSEFGITHLRHSSAIALSGGERRRVEIARALAGQPKFMLLDEPLAGIDPIAIGDIKNLVAHLKDRGIGVLITDHNVRDTLGIVDRAYIMHEGKILINGTPDEIVKNTDARRYYLGEEFRL